MRNQLTNFLCKLLPGTSGLLLVALIACGGGNAVLISQTEIDSARNRGELPALFHKANTLVNEKSGSSKKDAIALRSKIAQLLVEEKSALVDAMLAKHAKDPTSVSRQSLLALQASIAPMIEWSATDYARVTPKVDGVLARVNQAIAGLIAESNLESKDQVASILALQKAAKLAGEGQPEQKQYQTAFSEAISQLIYQGSDSLNRRLYGSAITAAKAGLAIDPGNVQFESMLSQGQAGLFEKDFRFALENGKPELAYQSMLTIADSPIFLQLKKSMEKSILLLANYFAGSAQKAYQEGDLSTAYENFVKARTVQEKVGVVNSGFIQEKRFLDLLMGKVKQSGQGEGYSLAMLSVLKEFDPNYPGLDNELLKTRDSVKSRAMTKLAIAEFKEVPSQDSVIASVGRRVGSKLEKILFDQLGNEVLIVTATQSARGNDYQGLALQVDGEVLQSAIEINSNLGKRTQRVVTGVNRVETEEYTKWAKRKRGDAPRQYDETLIEEDVELTVEHIRKQAVVEVAFRVIEPANGSILMTDNVAKGSQFKGESINEFQKGDFHQPYVPADMPTDIKIMDTLATELAVSLGEKLASYLQSPEKVFYQKAQDAKAQGNSQVAIELLANAIAIAEGKGLDISAWTAEIKALALAQK
jgi:hypothetical protein